MKKIIAIILIALFKLNSAAAQIEKPVKLEIKKDTIKTTKQIPVKVVENKTTPPVQANNAPVYSLTSVRVNIRTGSDNKEFPSKVYVKLMMKSDPHYYVYVQNNLNNEMRINSDTEFGLERGNEGTPERITLEALQTAGLILEIYYDPNLFTDAWKIENISMVLEFKDQNGNLHPSLGRKTLVFTNAYGFLNAGVRYMQCITDKSFTPLTATIK